MEYLPLIFRRCVLAILGARTPAGVVFEPGMLDQLVVLAERYLLELTQHLCRISGMQRRQRPSIDDVALAMFLNELNITDLEKEATVHTPLMEESLPVSTLNSLYFDPEEAEIDPESRPFFEADRHLVPSTRPRPKAMADWMPPLPPNHTYMHTPSHSSTIRDLRHVRLQLVDEGRLAERALQRMLGDKGSASVIELNARSGRARAASMQINDRPTPAAPSPAAAAPAAAVPVVPAAAQPPAEAAAAAPEVAAAAAAPTGAGTGGASADTAPKLKFKIHLPKPEPDAAPKLKLSLSKPKKKKEVSVVGKRPRVDLVELARNGKRQETDTDEKMEDEKEPFQAALESVM